MLRFNEINWTVFRLGENTTLLRALSILNFEEIHQSTYALKKILGNKLTDIVPAYDSIALFGQYDILIEILNQSVISTEKFRIKQEPLEIPICYEKGLDLDLLSDSLKISIEEIIRIHLKGIYRSLFIGFTPGFIYADGLDRRLAYPRKKNPRTHILSGSVGIGGEQTGIYSLDSPGGWNIIGRTPIKLFNVEEDPPMKIQVGTPFTFKRINNETFEEWENSKS